MYNAMPVEGVVYLCEFMRTFMHRYPETRTQFVKAKL